MGFLVYIAGTYTMFVPYLKGIYPTLNSWNLGRTADRWPLPGFEQDFSEVVKDDENELVLPIWVKIVTQLKSDLEALLKLINDDKPPELPIRSPCPQATYVIGDSSGTCFGTCIWIQGDKRVQVEFGQWSKDVELGESSNFREATNLVIKTITMMKTSQIKKVFICMDNMVMKQTYMKGSSNSAKFHNLIVKLRKLEMEGKLIIHFIWIASTWMVAQGTDALC